MNQSKIEDAVNNISDRAVSEALDIDSAEKLREAAKPELKRSRMKLIRRVSALAACLCVCICAAALVVHFNKPSEGLVSVSSPVFQVDSAEEMIKYLGFFSRCKAERPPPSSICTPTTTTPNSGKSSIPTDQNSECSAPAATSAGFSALFLTARRS